MHPPTQLHRIVHLIPALAHMQFPLHAFPHPQWWRRAHALLASSRTVQNGTQCFAFTSCVQSRMLLISVPLHNILVITKRVTACKWDSPTMSSQILVFCVRETLSYHTIVRIWSRSILERSCHLQLRRHSAMRTTDARISMTPSLVTVWGTVLLPSQTPSRGQLSRRSQDVQMIQRTEAKSLHWEKTSHSYALFSYHCSPGQISTWTTSSSMKTRKSHHRCLTRESSDPAQILMSYNVWLSQNSHLLMMLRWRCWMAQLWFTWFAQPTELTTSNMLCVTSCHSLPTLLQIRHRDSTSFGTTTLITTSKPRLRQNEATPAWQPSSKAVHLYLVTGTSF